MEKNKNEIKMDTDGCCFSVCLTFTVLKSDSKLMLMVKMVQNMWSALLWQWFLEVLDQLKC